MNKSTKDKILSNCYYERTINYVYKDKENAWGGACVGIFRKNIEIKHIKHLLEIEKDQSCIITNISKIKI